MAAEALVDSNMLVYAHDSTDYLKHQKASEILSLVWKKEKRFAVSLQNLSECFTIVTKKIKNPLPVEEARWIVQDITRFDHWVVLVPDIDCFLDAIKIVSSFKIPFWNAQLLAIMRKNEIDTIITENEKDFEFPGVKVVNPFKGAHSVG